MHCGLGGIEETHHRRVYSAEGKAQQREIVFIFHNAVNYSIYPSTSLCVFCVSVCVFLCAPTVTSPRSAPLKPVHRTRTQNINVKNKMWKSKQHRIKGVSVCVCVCVLGVFVCAELAFFPPFSQFLLFNAAAAAAATAAWFFLLFLLLAVDGSSSQWQSSK